MSKLHKLSRETIRDGTKNIKSMKLFLYGKLDFKHKALAYCRLHKCYLTEENINEKNCKMKKCRKYKEIKKRK